MIGIIGGSGLYAMGELGTPRAHTVTTPFGAPSSPLMTGTLRGREVAFLARHGLQHQLLPGEINFRANIWALKSLGVRTVIGVSAVGSLREEIRPGDLALPSQYLDFTRGTRAASFFGGGVGAPISSAPPPRPAPAPLVARGARRAYPEPPPPLPRPCRTGRARGARRRCGAAPGQDLRLRRGSAPRHPRGEPVPARGGCGYRRHNQRAGGIPRPGGATRLLHHRGRDRLRLLARGSNTTCLRGTDTEAVPQQSRPRAAAARRDGGGAPGGRITALPPGAAWRAAHAARAAERRAARAA